MVPNVWRRRVVDGRGSSQPADEIILTENGNILAEHKRTAGTRFDFNFLRPNQARGLVDFDKVLPRNYGIVFVSFQNKALDEAYAIRFISALDYMRRWHRLHIPICDLRTGIRIPSVPLPRIFTEHGPAYDLQELVKCCKFL